MTVTWAGQQESGPAVAHEQPVPAAELVVTHAAAAVVVSSMELAGAGAGVGAAAAAGLAEGVWQCARAETDDAGIAVGDGWQFVAESLLASGGESAAAAESMSEAGFGYTWL